jgi:hypothetical protein
MGRQLTRGAHNKVIGMVVMVAIILSCMAPCFAEEKEESKKEGKSRVGLVFSLGILAAGSIFAYYQYSAAKDDFAIYRKSAFTANTTDLRKNVEQHDLLTIIGAVAAGAGAIGVVVSF